MVQGKFGTDESRPLDYIVVYRHGKLVFMFLELAKLEATGDGSSCFGNCRLYLHGFGEEATVECFLVCKNRFFVN